MLATPHVTVEPRTKVIFLSGCLVVDWRGLRKRLGPLVEIKCVMHGELEALIDPPIRSTEPGRERLTFRISRLFRNLRREVDVFGFLSVLRRVSNRAVEGLSGRFRGEGQQEPVSVQVALERMGREQVTPVVLSQHIYENLPSTFPNREAAQVITMPMPWSRRVKKHHAPSEDKGPLRVIIYGHGGPVAKELCDAIIASNCGTAWVEVIHLGMNTNLIDHFPFAKNLSPNRMMPRERMVEAAKLGDVLLYPYRPEQYQLCSSLAPFEAIWLGLPIIGIENHQLRQIGEISNKAVQTFDDINEMVRHLLLLKRDPYQLTRWTQICESQRSDLIEHLRSNHCNL